jgi:hypothetical protein
MSLLKTPTIFNDEVVQNKTFSIPSVISKKKYKKSLIKNTKNIFKEHIEQVSRQQKVNFKFLLTYGVGITTFIGPVERILSGNYSNFFREDVLLLIVTSITILFFESKDYLNTLKIFNQKDLTNELQTVQSFIKRLKNSINNIVNIMGLSLYRMLDIISYCFILPILNIVKNQIGNGVELSMVDILNILEYVLIASTITSIGLLLKKGLTDCFKKLD